MRLGAKLFDASSRVFSMSYHRYAVTLFVVVSLVLIAWNRSAKTAYA